MTKRHLEPHQIVFRGLAKGLLLALVLVVWWVTLPVTCRGNAIRPSVDIPLGVPRAELEAVLDAEPVHTCTYDVFTSYHYLTKSFFQPSEYEFPSQVETVAEIPRIYDHVQILVNGNGIVVAQTWNGEEYTIETVLGDFPGSAMCELPEGAFDEFSAYHP